MPAAILEPLAPPHDTRPPDARERDEVWHGVPHMAPMPNGVHQDLAADLREFLKRFWAKPNGGLARPEVNVTTPQDEDDWTSNYRIPDIVLLDKARLHIDKNEYMVGAPLVVIEVYSPGDESYEKLDFYAALGVPEVWIIDRDTKVPEVRMRNAAGEYDLLPPDAAGWHVSPNTGIQMRETPGGKLRIRVGTDDTTTAELPD